MLPVHKWLGFVKHCKLPVSLTGHFKQVEIDFSSISKQSGTRNPQMREGVAKNCHVEGTVLVVVIRGIGVRAGLE